MTFYMHPQQLQRCGVQPRSLRWRHNIYPLTESYSRAAMPKELTSGAKPVVRSRQHRSRQYAV